MHYARSLRDILGEKKAKTTWMAEAIEAERVTTPDIVEYLSNPKGPLPKRLDINDLVERIIETHGAAGGSTFNPHFGNLKGKKLYAVSVYPDRGKILEGNGIDP